MNVLFPQHLTAKDLLISESFDCFQAFGNGRYQKRLVLLLALSVFLSAGHIHIVPMIVTGVDHWCKQPSHSNISEASWKNTAIPLGADGQHSQCDMYEMPEEPNSTATVPCQEWEYEERSPGESVVNVWDLVCWRKPLIVLMIVVQNIGASLYVVAAGLAADRIGRKPVMLSAMAVLLLSTAALCLCTAYSTFVTALFFVTGSGFAALGVSSVLLFEVTAHENRPAHNIFAGTFGLLAMEFWRATVEYNELGWKLKLVHFLLPTVLTLPSACIVSETPRWLVSRLKLRHAEVVMTTAANVNHFPLANTACLLDKLKNNIAADVEILPDSDKDLLARPSIQKHAKTMFITTFTALFGYYSITVSPLWKNNLTLGWVSFGAVILGYIALITLIRKMILLAVIIGIFTLLFGLHCLLSITITTAPLVVSEALLVITKSCYYAAAVLVGVYTMELFPTAVRCAALCVTIGGGVLGAGSSSVTVVLNDSGREDLAFALPACLFFGSLLALRRLPRTTTVECATEAASTVSSVSKKTIDRMKNTLQGGIYVQKKAKKGIAGTKKPPVGSRPEQR
ncbi:hypothetical protein V5799_022494 [Amblyomma americanum]|uniref:Uncharacterized protein n=1 Tax=Amblyomma americanum TaxID=6943 RepID=A0AAQ4FKP4_AMBAM